MQIHEKVDIKSSEDVGIFHFLVLVNFTRGLCTRKIPSPSVQSAQVRGSDGKTLKLYRRFQVKLQNIQLYVPQRLLISWHACFPLPTGDSEIIARVDDKRRKVETIQTECEVRRICSSERMKSKALEKLKSNRKCGRPVSQPEMESALNSLLACLILSSLKTNFDI